MQNLFLTEEDVFEIKIFVAEDADSGVCCDLDKEGVKFLLNGFESDIEEYTIVFKKPSFGDLIALTDVLLYSNGISIASAGLDINPITAKLKMMSCLLRDWDFKDSKGNKIPPTEESLKKINPIIATSISLQLEDYLKDNKTEEENNEAEQIQVEE